MLDEILKTLTAMSPEDQAVVTNEVMGATAQFATWVPQPGPQTEAYLCEADELFYGGQAGGGKTDLLVGLSLTAHRRSLIMRRQNKEAKKLNERYVEVIGSRDGYNGQDNAWRLAHPLGQRVIELAGCQLESDKENFKGNPHDLKGYDEICDFTRSIYVFTGAWCRTTDPGQRCRKVATGNPPTQPEGYWVIEHWAPWLDPTHARPAKSGELRWFARDEAGKEIEVDGPGEYDLGGPRPVKAISRTFIRATLDDNAYLRDTNYRATLDSLPKELRDAYRDGRFDLGMKDKEWQVIPLAWIRAAQDRWREHGKPKDVPMCAIGVDVTGGGDDENVLAPRWDGYFGPLVCIPGSETPFGEGITSHVLRLREDHADIVVDMGGGWGNQTYNELHRNEVTVVAYMGGGTSNARTRPDGKFGFKNKRAEDYWRFREALDPNQEGGSRIMLPDDPQMVSDLTSVTYKIVGTIIQMISKGDLKPILGRSPDRGDAVVMSWSTGGKMPSHFKQWSDNNRRPQVNLGRTGQKRKH